MAVNGKAHPSDSLRDEINFGGSLSPCPLCAKPRSRRSDYIRCTSCAVNWIDGVDLDLHHHPSIERMQKLLAVTAAGKTRKEIPHAQPNHHHPPYPR